MLKLTKKELSALRDSLPEGGYKLVSEKLTNVSPETVRKVLNEQNRYNAAVIDATIDVINDLKSKLDNQKLKIKEALS